MLQREVKCSLVVGVCALLFSLSAQAGKPLYNPDPIQVPCKLPMDEVKKAVWVGLTGRTWNPAEKTPGQIEAKVVVRGKHTLVTDVKYSAASVLIRYKSSDNLDYEVDKNGTPYIHKNANSWIQNIENDIRKHLTTYCALAK